MLYLQDQPLAARCSESRRLRVDVVRSWLDVDEYIITQIIGGGALRDIRARVLNRHLCSRYRYPGRIGDVPENCALGILGGNRGRKRDNRETAEPSQQVAAARSIFHFT